MFLVFFFLFCYTSPLFSLFFFFHVVDYLVILNLLWKNDNEIRKQQIVNRLVMQQQRLEKWRRGWWVAWPKTIHFYTCKECYQLNFVCCSMVLINVMKYSWLFSIQSRKLIKLSFCRFMLYIFFSHFLSLYLLLQIAVLYLLLWKVWKI